MKKIFICIFININLICMSVLHADYYFNTKAKTAILIESDTGKVLFNKNAEQKMYPASLTKLLTLYIIFDQLSKNNIQLNTEVHISRNAYINGNKLGSSTMFLSAGDVVTVSDLIYGITVLSGNDATIAMAEEIAGSEKQFVEYMKIYAAKLGLQNTHFINCTGWPDINHYSSAHDIARIARALILDFPQYYYFFSVKKFTYKDIIQYNRNSLLFDKTMNVDGLKTGHTSISGYNLVVSDLSHNMRLIAVVDGLNSNQQRNLAAKNLLNWGFFNFSKKILYKANTPVINLKVLNGKKGSINLYSNQDIGIVYNHNTEKLSDYKAIITYENILIPPVYKNQIFGKVIIYNTKTQQEQKEYPLYAKEDVKKAGFFTRFFNVPYYIFIKIFGNY